MSPAHGPNLYDLLGVPADADRTAIQRAFRARAREAHPDVGGDPEAFRQLRDAFEVLTDPVRRKEHDDRLGIRIGGPAGDARGWSGRQGSFTGDVEFPAYLRDVVETPWQAAPSTPEGATAPTYGPSGPVAPRAEVAWWWPHQATTAPLPAGPLVVLAAGSRVVGVDGGSGLDAWQADLGARIEARPVLATPTQVAVGLAGGSVEALELGSGALRWQHHLGVPLATELVAWDDRLAVGAGAAVVALDAADGRRRWATKVAGPVTSATVADGHLVVTTASRTVHGLELGRGRQRWWVRATPAVAPPPCAVGGVVWMVVGGGRLACVVAATGAVAATADVGAAVAGMVGHGARLLASVAGPARVVALGGDGVARWTAPLGSVAPEPTVAAGRVVVAESTGTLRWLDPADGTDVARAALAFEPVGAPAVVADRVLVGDRAGTVWAIAVPPGAGG